MGNLLQELKLLDRRLKICQRFYEFHSRHGERDQQEWWLGQIQSIEDHGRQVLKRILTQVEDPK